VRRDYQLRHKEEDKQWIMSRPNGIIGELIGMIHEVLDQEKVMDLNAALIKHGLTLDNHGRPLRNRLDQEMGWTNLNKQKMEWLSRHDREIGWSSRNVREMVWKLKMNIQSWKWSNKTILINQIGLRSNLFRSNLKWNEPNKELVERGIYRPKKWKDKPA